MEFKGNFPVQNAVVRLGNRRFQNRHSRCKRHAEAFLFGANHLGNSRVV